MKRHAHVDDVIPTDEELDHLRPAAEVFPPAVVRAYRRARGPQKAATKEKISLRVDAGVLEAYRATGRGWQGRMNETLAAHAPRARQRKTARTARPKRRV